MSAIEQWSKAFEGLLSDGRLAEGHWLFGARRAALARFVETGLPTAKTEDWKYTSVDAIRRGTFRPASDTDDAKGVDAAIEAHGLGDTAAAELVFVNGRFAAERSRTELPTGATARSLAEALEGDREAIEANLDSQSRGAELVFADLNTAFVEDGAWIDAAAGTVVEKPIHVIFVHVPGAEAQAVFPRVLVTAAERSQIRVVESHVSVGDGLHFSSAVAEVIAAPDAIVDHAQLVDVGDDVQHVGAVLIQQDRASRVTEHTLTLGGGLARSDVRTVLDAEGAECTLDGLYLATRNQHVDMHTVIDHAKPNTTSHELVKGVLDGRGRGVFNGRVLVRKDAQQINSDQTNRNLLLSDHARVDTKPELEIYADDVRCTHGATIGRLDEDAVFYLRSRGLSEKEARSMLTHAFSGEVLERLGIEVLRERLDARIHEWLPRVGGGVA